MEISAGMKNSLCEKFCPYYKPDKDEDLACLGFLVIEQLTGKGVPISCERRESTIHPAASERLLREMCIRCPFYENDCDFALVSRTNRGSDSVSSTPANSGERHLLEKDRIPSPCGGFTLLGYLLGENIINIDDIKKLI
jgi:hypothetical protein